MSVELAGPVRADQPGDAGVDVDGEAGQRRHVAGVPLGQRVRPDDGRRGARVTGAWPGAQLWRCSHGAKHAGPRCPASSSSGRYLTATRDQPGSLRPGHDAPDLARRYGEEVSAEPGRPPLSMRVKERAWTRLDWALAVVCALLVYGITFHGHGFYVFPLSIWVAACGGRRCWPSPWRCRSGLRRRDPIGALILALVGCSVIVAVGGEINRGPFLPLALVLFTVAAIVQADGRGRRAHRLAGTARRPRAHPQHRRPRLGPGDRHRADPDHRLDDRHQRAAAPLLHRPGARAGGHHRGDRGTAADRQGTARRRGAQHDGGRGAGRLRRVRLRHRARAGTEALGDIQHVTREALADMQRLLGVLRQDGTGQPVPTARRPAGEGQRQARPGSSSSRPPPAWPTWTGWCPPPQARASAWMLTRTGDHRDVPAGIDQSAFRIVQEALTNVVKHSGASTCRVDIGYERRRPVRGDHRSRRWARCAGGTGPWRRASRTAPATASSACGSG